jgi:hypothetical protein
VFQSVVDRKGQSAQNGDNEDDIIVKMAETVIHDFGD